MKIHRTGAHARAEARKGRGTARDTIGTGIGTRQRRADAIGTGIGTGQRRADAIGTGIGTGRRGTPREKLRRGTPREKLKSEGLANRIRIRPKAILRRAGVHRRNRQPGGRKTRKGPKNIGIEMKARAARWKETQTFTMDERGKAAITHEVVPIADDPDHAKTRGELSLKLGRYTTPQLGTEQSNRVANGKGVRIGTTIMTQFPRRLATLDTRANGGVNFGHTPTNAVSDVKTGERGRTEVEIQNRARRQAKQGLVRATAKTRLKRSAKSEHRVGKIFLPIKGMFAHKTRQ